MTKEKILTASSKLFYQKGIANVRLQQIADSVHISVGNLAYHFASKQAIVNAVYTDAFAELDIVSSQMFTTNDLADFDSSLKNFFKFQTSYNFCFNNVWEISRNYPDLNQQWKSLSSRITAQIHKRFTNFIASGHLVAEPQKAAYKLLAENLLLIMLSWAGQQSIKGKPAALAAFRRATWAIVIPNLTEKGRNACQALGLDLS